MRLTTTRDFFRAGVYYVGRTWPYSVGEVATDALDPMVKRLVIMLLLLGNFRYLGKNAEPGMSGPEILELLWPVFASVAAVMVLPLTVAGLNRFCTRMRKRKSTRKVKREFSRRLFGEDEIHEQWDEYYQGQRAIMTYVVFMILISPIFLYYNWHLFVVYFVVAVVFATVCTKRLFFSDDNKLGWILNRFIGSKVYLNTMRNSMFCVYIVICALVIVLEPKRMSVEFLFVVIIGMRVQLARGKSVIGFFLWEADNRNAYNYRDSDD